MGRSRGCVLESISLLNREPPPAGRHVRRVSARQRPGGLLEEMEQAKEREGERLAWPQAVASNGSRLLQGAPAAEWGCRRLMPKCPFWGMYLLS